MTNPPEAPQPAEALAEAIVEAARQAKIGIAVSYVEDGVINHIYVSDAAAELLGASREEVIARGPWAYIAKDEHERLRGMLARRDTFVGLTFETIVEQPNGQRIPVGVTATHMAVAGRNATVSFFSDITERRRAEHEFKASEARFRRLIEGAPDGIVISREGVILYANSAAAMQLGAATAADLLGKSLAVFLPPAEIAVMTERTRAVVASNAPIGPREYTARRLDGTLITAEITSLPIEYDGGPAVIAIARDVTERVRLREQLAHTDRLTALGSLAAGVAHEINNPLAFASLGLEAVEKHLAHAIPDEAQRAEALALIGDVRLGVDRVAGIVRDLKSFSRPNDDQIGPMDITAVLRSVERMVAREIRPRAVFSVELPWLPPVQGNVARLEQVFVNLLLNAAQAMSEDGVANLVSVRGQHTPQGTVEIEVRDNGPGMTSEVQKRIFEPFFTTKPVGVGMGLGLSVCHGIVTRLGGTITIESTLGRGTVACVSLPVSTTHVRSSTLVPATPRSRVRGKILIVDDEAAVGVTLKYLLDDRHDVTTLTDGEAALTLLLGGAPFDLVLCDLMMPGFSGMEVHARLATDAPGLERKLVFMTGGAFTPRAITFLATVPNARVEKPFSVSTIEELVEERLALRTASDRQS